MDPRYFHCHLSLLAQVREAPACDWGRLPTDVLLSCPAPLPPRVTLVVGAAFVIWLRSWLALTFPCPRTADVAYLTEAKGDGDAFVGYVAVSGADTALQNCVSQQ